MYDTMLSGHLRLHAKVLPAPLALTVVPVLPPIGILPEKGSLRKLTMKCDSQVRKSVLGLIPCKTARAHHRTFVTAPLFPVRV